MLVNFGFGESARHVPVSHDEKVYLPNVILYTERVIPTVKSLFNEAKR